MLVFLDSDAPATSANPDIVHWNGRSAGGPGHFLLDYCEENAERLRAKYGNWVYELGETTFSGKKLVEHLALEEGLSYWWLTLITEMSVWKSPGIHDAIRLLAAEELIRSRKQSAVQLVSDDPRLHASFRAMCARLGARYTRDRAATGGRSAQLQTAKRLPHFARGAITLARYAGARWPFRRAPRPIWFSGEQALFIGSLFFNVDSSAAVGGRFHSHFWNGLHGLMGRLGLHGNWVHIFIPQTTIPTPERALEVAREFNRKPDENGSHVFVDGFLSFPLLLRVIAKWVRLLRISFRIKGLRGAFTPKGSAVSFWSVLGDDWFSSMRGSVAVNNLLWLELYDAALKTAPRQRRGLYLCENHSWERGFVHSWKKHGHGEIIAVPHSTRSFWDLRFYQDGRTYRAAQPYPIPQPDFTAVNGRAARSAYLGENYPPERIVECEAFRYMYLENLIGTARETARDGQAVRILVLGDYLASTTRSLLRLLEAAVKDLATPRVVTVKPHPHFIVDPAEFPSLKLEVVHAPLGEILSRFDMAFASSTSSASVDSYLAGVPTVVMVEVDRLNLSPLWRHGAVRFVSSARQLADAITATDAVPAGSDERDDFFFLDPDLPRWQRVLSTLPTAVTQSTRSRS